VQQIEVSPHVPSKAYACILRYQLGDFEPHAYKTENYGETWTRITTGINGIPEDFPVRVVREDPSREGLLYAGTEFGMFISFDDGMHWQSFQLNLPATPVTDIRIVDKDLVLSTMGRSFWILYDLTPLYEISEKTVASTAQLFGVKAPFRIYAGRFSRRPSGPDAPQYPNPGANIDYYLASEAEGEIKLAILDVEGNLVREFSSEEKKITPPDDSGQRESEREEEGRRLRPRPKLATNAGMHRFVWDLRFPGPWHEDPKRSERSGPMVPPGMYQARLTVGKWSSGVSFEVKMDPRVLKEGITEADVSVQAEFALKVRDTLSDARRVAAKIATAIKEKGKDEEILAAAKKQLISDPGHYSQPMLLAQMEYLYSNLIRADQRPGQDAYDRYEELNSALQEQTKKLED
jgi:hypothetical protein